MTQGTLITHTVETLTRLGVNEICVAAGARNAPFVAALMNCRGLTIWNFFEERCAGFFALGRVMDERRPVAVLTTSGTAAAELLPAMIEARYQGLPVVAVTADRPPSYRGSGAPQSIEQPGIFGVYATQMVDWSIENGDITPIISPVIGPIHINLCLDETIDPSLGELVLSAADTPLAELSSAQSILSVFEHLHRAAADEDLLVLAGGLHPIDAARITPFLAGLQAPIIAELTSNLTGISALVSLLQLGGEKALIRAPQKHVLRLGSVPSWRWWRDLETRADIQVDNFTTAPFPGLARRTGVRRFPLDSIPSKPIHNLPLAQHSPEDFQILPLLETYPRSEPALLSSIQRHFAPNSTIFLGNSLPIREMHLASHQPVRGVRFFANRGANGIDGLLSTFLGLSAKSANDAWIILGDLSALYDLAAPWITSQLPAARRYIVVVNNGGGMIFNRVPSLRTLPDSSRAVIENRHQLDFCGWAQLWGMSYQTVHDVADLDGLDDLGLGTHLVEVRPDATDTHQFWSAYDQI